MAGKKGEIRITAIIGKDAECSGDFSSGGSVRVDGTINGDVNVAETLILGATGVVNGDVVAKATIIGGEIYGNINSPERTELTSTARVLGDINTNVIVIDEKAIFQGRCDMNQEVPGKRVRPSSKALRAGKKTAKAAIAEALREVEEANREENNSSLLSASEQSSQEQ